MTNEFMLKLAKEYMQEMGIGRTQYIVVRHHNTDNDHLHIAYNRIDNDLKLISVNNDFKRNIEVCKKLKNKHNLTYGKGKERVKREKLNHPDKAKYKIYDSITKVLPHCKNENELRSTLKLFGIQAEFKLSRTTGEVQGISFRHGKISFKGSDIDRKFSFANLKKEFVKNNEQSVKAAQTAKSKEHINEVVKQFLDVTPPKSSQHINEAVKQFLGVTSPKNGDNVSTPQKQEHINEAVKQFLDVAPAKKIDNVSRPQKQEHINEAVGQFLDVAPPKKKRQCCYSQNETCD